MGMKGFENVGPLWHCGCAAAPLPFTPEQGYVLGASERDVAGDVAC